MFAAMATQQITLMSFINKPTKGKKAKELEPQCHMSEMKLSPFSIDSSMIRESQEENLLKAPSFHFFHHGSVCIFAAKLKSAEAKYLYFLSPKYCQ